MIIKTTSIDHKVTLKVKTYILNFNEYKAQIQQNKADPAEIENIVKDKRTYLHRSL